MTSLANMSPTAVAAWGRLTQKYPSLSVSSAYRDPATNARVGGAKKSQHMHGNAFDVPVSDKSREEVLSLIVDAKAAGFTGIGVYNNSLHFDVGPPRAWGPSYRSDSIPDWAKPALYQNAGATGAPVTSSPAPSATVQPPQPTPEPGAPVDPIDPDAERRKRFAMLIGQMQSDDVSPLEVYASTGALDIPGPVAMAYLGDRLPPDQRAALEDDFEGGYVRLPESILRMLEQQRRRRV